jgi:type I restriction enzyme, S subunit
MKTEWPQVKLAEVLHHRKEFIIIDDLAVYRRPRVQLHAQGIVLRDQIAGALIKTKKQQICHAGEFLVAEIDAKVGGFGVVPESLDGAIVSSHYFLFVINEAKLDQRFLDYFIRTPAFRKQVEAQGSTNYAAIRPSHVLDYQIPVPPLDEQRQIVEKIAALEGKIHDAYLVRQDIEGDLDTLLSAVYQQITQGAPKKPLGELAPLNRRPVVVQVDGMYPQVAVRSFGRGTFHKPSLNGSDVTWQKPFLVRAGDILVSNIKAWEGAIAVASAEDDGRVGSHRYLTCVPLRNVTRARFVCFHLLTFEGLYDVGEASPGSADRNRTLSAKGLLRIPVPAPTYKQQVWFEAVWEEVDKVKQLHAEIVTTLDALMPSILEKAFRGEL